MLYTARSQLSVRDLCDPKRYRPVDILALLILSESIHSFISIQLFLGRFWQEPDPSQATGMALVHCVLGKFLGVGCHCFPLPLDIGREMAD
jgi:hypothetical protein